MKALLLQKKKLEEINITQLPSNGLRLIFSFCSPFDFPNLRKTCQTFASNTERSVFESALVQATADNLQKIPFFAKLLNNDETAMKGQAFSEAFNDLVNIPGSSQLREIDHYQIAQNNFVQQINQHFKQHPEKKEAAIETPSFDVLLTLLDGWFGFSYGRAYKQDCKERLFKINFFYAWDVVNQNRSEEHHDYVKKLLNDYILKHPANDWNGLALVSILKTLTRLDIEESSLTNHSDALEELEKAIVTTLYAILTSSGNHDGLTLVVIWKALLETPKNPRWNTSLDLVQQVYIKALTQGLNQKDCNEQTLATVLQTLLNIPEDSSWADHRKSAIRSSIYTIRNTPKKKVWDESTLADVLEALLKVKILPDKETKKEDTESLATARALIFHEIKSRIPGWNIVVLRTLLNISDIRPRGSGPSWQNPEITTEQLISATRQVSAQLAINGQILLPWQDGCVLAVCLEALFATTPATTAESLLKADRNMAIKNIISAINAINTNSQVTWGMVFAATLETLNKLYKTAVDTLWKDELKEMTDNVIKTMKDWPKRVCLKAIDYVYVLQAFNKTNIESLADSLKEARNKTLMLIKAYVEDETTLPAFFIIDLDEHNILVLLDALFSTPADSLWENNLSEAKWAVLKSVQDYYNDYNGATDPLTIGNALRELETIFTSGAANTLTIEKVRQLLQNR